MNLVLTITAEQVKLLESLVDIALRANGLQSLPQAVEVINILRAAKQEEPAPSEEKK